MSEHEAAFTKDYSKEGFWAKVKSVAKLAGAEVIEKGLIAFYTVQSPETPVWAKAVLIPALGYFISPVDEILDLTPVVGYADDLGVLVAALLTVGACVTDEIKAKDAAKVNEWFGA